MSDFIDQHKRMAMGQMPDVEPIESCFGKGRNIHGKEEVSRKMNGDRSRAHNGRNVDHGPSDMNG